MYQEQIQNGVLMYRENEHDAWQPVPAKELTARIVKQADKLTQVASLALERGDIELRKLAAD